MEENTDTPQLEMKDVVIRVASEVDMYDIMALDREIFPGNSSTVALFTHCLFLQRSYVAVTPKGGVMIGYIVVNTGDVGKTKVAEICAFGVAEFFRNRGIGTRLLESVILDSIEKEDDLIKLYTDIQNKSIGLYHSFGFRVLSFIEKYYENERSWLARDASDDAYLMIKAFIPFEVVKDKIDRGW